MKRLLVCTIARDVRPCLDTWFQQIFSLRNRLAEAGWVCELSVYENDSMDGTAEWLRFMLAPSDAIMLSTEKLGTQRYPSVWSLDRLRNLAAARQACLDQVGDLSRFDKIAYVEPDVTYDPHWAKELVLARHPQAAGLGEPDIYSGWSLRSESHPKESTFLYDTCATRASPLDTCWDIGEEGGQWRGKSLIPTNLGGVDNNCLHRVWSAFNGFCVYNARPFTEGLKWDYLNPRLNTGQQHITETDETGRVIKRQGWLDADTAVMCEAFRARGYNGVYLNTNVLVRHA